jgi:rhodanese-related sulfurtransferase
MGWEVAVLDGVRAADGPERGPGSSARSTLPGRPAMPAIARWSAAELATALVADRAVVLDLGRYDEYRAGHVAGARWASRDALAHADADGLPVAETYVVTADDPILIAFAVADLDGRLPGRVVGLAGGTVDWAAAGRPIETGAGQPLTEPLDRYRRPYEGTEVSPEAMHAYLQWEYGLVAQLDRDGTHGLRVLAPV